MVNRDESHKSTTLEVFGRKGGRRRHTVVSHTISAPTAYKCRMGNDAVVSGDGELCTAGMCQIFVHSCFLEFEKVTV